MQGSGSYSLKEDVLIRVRLSYFADPMFYNYVKFFMFYIAEGDGKVPGTHPTRSVEIGSGSYSLRETHRFYLCVFLLNFLSAVPILNFQSELMYRAKWNERTTELYY